MNRHLKKMLASTLGVWITLSHLSGCSSTSLESSAHNVYFIYNYDGAPEPKVVSVDNGQMVTEIDTPVRDKFLFSGWYTNPYGTNGAEYDFSLPVMDTTRLFAIWNQAAVTITFVESEDSSSTVSLELDDSGVAYVSKPSNPEREDYEFIGWFSNPQRTEPFDFSKPISKDITIYAKWRQLVATITFCYYDEQTTSTRVNLEDGIAYISRPENDPNRDDYEFIDWFADAQCTKNFDFSKPITGNTTIYAGWKLVIATVVFDENYEGGLKTAQKVNVGEPVDSPESPDRTGYLFLGWYLDAECSHKYDFASLVTDNLVLYAGWKLQSYTITFNNNYTGAPSSFVTEVPYGSAVSMPSDPTRSGYTFMGWYTDIAGTLPYDFTLPVTKNLELYAGWLSDAEAANTVAITYLLNYDGGGTYSNSRIQKGRRVSEPQKPVRKGYYFAGWFTESSCINKFNFTTTFVKSDTTLYAKWLKKYNFEAEYTKNQGGNDYSGVVQSIKTDAKYFQNYQDMGVSGDYFLFGLMYNGATVRFNINSSKAVNDAIIILRLTPDRYDMVFTDQTFKVLVNNTALSYGSISLTGAIADGDGGEKEYKRPFENYDLAVPVSLVQGANTIELVVNNNVNHGGTWEAEVPLIDCMYICSDSTLSWSEYDISGTTSSNQDVLDSLDFFIEEE